MAVRWYNRNPKYSQRPEGLLRLNRNSSLFHGLVFAGLGGVTKTNLYHDSSLYANHGTLTNMDPVTDWVFDPVLGRFGVNFNSQASQSVSASRAFQIGNLDFCVSCWAILTSTVTTSQAAMMGCGDSGGTEWMFRVALSNADTSYLSFYAAAGNILASQAIGGFRAYKNVPVHLAARRQSGVLDVLLNGSVVATDDTAEGSLTTTKVLQIGGADSAASRWWKGDIYDPMVWVGVSCGDSFIQQLADPSNTLLSGLILPPRRTLFPTAIASESTGGWFPIYTHRGRLISAA